MGFKTLTASEMQEIKQYTDDDGTNWSNMPDEFSDKVRRGIAAGLVNESAFAWFDDKCRYKGSTMKVFTEVGDRMFDKQGQARQTPQQPSPTIVNYHMNGPGARVNTNSTDYSISDNRDSQGNEKDLKTQADSLKSAPMDALTKGNKEKNRLGLKERIENHIVVIFSTIAIGSFAAGIGVREWMISASSQEVVTKGSFTLNSEITNLIDEKYVEIEKYQGLVKDYDDLKVVANRVTEKINSQILNQIEKIRAEKEQIEKSLPDIRARNSPIFFPDPEKPQPVSKEEQDAKDKIVELRQSLSILYDKLSPK